jgi:hypothetical protein
MFPRRDNGVAVLPNNHHGDRRDTGSAVPPFSATIRIVPKETGPLPSVLAHIDMNHNHHNKGIIVITGEMDKGKSLENSTQCTADVAGAATRATVVSPGSQVDSCSERESCVMSTGTANVEREDYWGAMAADTNDKIKKMIDVSFEGHIAHITETFDRLTNENLTKRQEKRDREEQKIRQLEDSLRKLCVEVNE